MEIAKGARSVLTKDSIGCIRVIQGFGKTPISQLVRLKLQDAVTPPGSAAHKLALNPKP